MAKPQISVIIPAHNEAKLIGHCLTALQNQTYSQAYEIIVVDNNSTDNTAKIAKTLKVKLVKETTLGPAAARNAGAKKAQADILAFTDADTLPPSNWLEHISQAFKAQPNIVALVGTMQLSQTTKLLKLLNRLVLPTADHLHQLIAGHYAFRGTNFAIKKTVFNQAGGFNPQFRALEDVELASRVSQLGQISYLPHLKVKTTDRRFRQRLSQYLAYTVPTYISVAILKKPPKKPFPNIR